MVRKLIYAVLQWKWLQPLRRRMRENHILAHLYRKVMNITLEDIALEESAVEQILAIQNQMIDQFVETSGLEWGRFLFVIDLQGIQDDDIGYLMRQTIDSLIELEDRNWCLLVLGKSTSHWERADERIVFNKDYITSFFDYVCELTPGSTLHRCSLGMLLRQDNFGVNLYYCDHLSSDLVPTFKPQWNKELAYSNYYMGHGCFYPLDKFMSFEHWLNFHSHYQRVLYLIEENNTQFTHVEHLLIKEGLGLASETADDDLLALNRYLSTYGANATLGLLPKTYKVRWPLPDAPPLVSIIIPTKDRKDLVEQCIQSIYTTTEYPNFEIILVDNQSYDLDANQYFQRLQHRGRIRLYRYEKPFNYSAINNFAVTKAKGRHVILMNNDIEVISETWLEDMVRQLEREEVGCVGAKLYYPDNTIQHAGVILGLGRCAGHSHKHYGREESGYMNRLKLTQNYGAVTAACLGIRKSVFNSVGGLNEANLSVAFNDVDLCLKVQAAGYQNVWSPFIEMYHHESVSRGDDHAPEHFSRFMAEVNYMQKTWNLDNCQDPAYSPWLTIEREDFTI